MTVKHLLFLHTDCNQLPTRSSWNTKDSPDPSWLSSVMDRSNGANNPAKWWVIQKLFPFGLGRSFHAHSEHGCIRSSLPAPECAVGSGHPYPEIRLHRGRRLQPESHRVQRFSMCPQPIIHASQLCQADPANGIPWTPLFSGFLARLSYRRWERGKERKPRHPFLHPSCSGTVSAVISTSLHLFHGSSVHWTPGTPFPPHSFSPQVVTVSHRPMWDLTSPYLHEWCLH